MTRTLPVLLIALVVSACSGSGGGTPDAGATDPGTDAVLADETAADAPTADPGIADVPVESDPGIAPDVAPTDVPVDVAVDVPAGDAAEVGPDAPADAAIDAPVDTAPEAAIDAEADATADAALDAPSDASTGLPEAVAALLEARGLPEMTVLLDTDEIDAQAAAYPGPVTFVQALESALDSFLSDDSDPECPLALVEADELGPCQDGTLKEQLLCYMNDPATTLALVTLDGKPWPPEHGEPLSENWVFFLSIDHLSDVLNWAIVDRAGVAATYNYGFN